MSSSHGELDAAARVVPTYLREVMAAIREALAHSAVARREAMDGLLRSPLERRSRLEGIVEDLVSSGGKMLRPRLALLGYLAAATAGSDACEHGDCAEVSAAAPTWAPLVRLGSALELLHAFGLLQDDVMDESATRRGRPTAHERLATGAEPLVGEGRRLGESVAVLAGDLAFALAQRQIRGLPDAVADAWDDTVVELVQGQRLDIVFAAEGRVDLASTHRVAQAKSGSYTFTRPLQLGALLARPHEPTPDHLRRLGAHLGQAFALSDDILGIWGDPAVTGKPAGDDLAQRKPTTVLGIAEALMHGRLDGMLRDAGPAPSPRRVADLVAELDRAGVRAEAQRHVAAHVEAARAELDHIRCAHVCAELEAIADSLVGRPA